MGSLSQETQRVQNPALGAMLLWRFTHGYEQGSKSKDHTPIPLLFLVLPIMLYEETFRFVKSTRRPSGLRSFAGKFSESSSSKNDIVLGINERAIKLRNLSMAALRLAIASRLIAIAADEGAVFSLSSTQPRTHIPAEIRLMLVNAEKLGHWCAQVSLHEISIILKIRF
jgi:ABC-3C biological conflict system middle component